MYNSILHALILLVTLVTAQISLSLNTSRAGDIRLVGGRNESEGRVEIFIHGLWGTICDDGWDIDDAAVVCRQLGYHSLVAMKRKSFFGSNYMLPIILDEVNCNGNEIHLLDCESKPLFHHNCALTESAGVLCAGPRLFNSTNSSLPFNHTSWVNEMNLCVAEDKYWLCSSDRECCYSSTYCCVHNDTVSVTASSLILYIVIGVLMYTTLPIVIGACIFICLINRGHIKKNKFPNSPMQLVNLRDKLGESNDQSLASSSQFQ